MYDKNLWDEILKIISKSVDADLVDTWLKPANIDVGTGEGVILSVPNKFFKSWIDKHYSKIILSILKDEFGIERPLKIIIEADKQPHKIAAKKSEKKNVPAKQSLLYSEYTFDNFVSGDSNNFAYAAALTVADGNFSIYNPLYIYGSTGLGKTHLIHAISNRIRQKFPKLNIMYMDAETFTNEIINVFAKHKGEHQQDQIESMKERFLSADVFVLDDIQFLKDRPKSLEFFFNIFNGFQMQQKQVIITSDESPQEINMAERMKSRFASGFQAEILPPTVEERVAILHKKAEELNTPITEHVAIFLAENTATTNSRELIAALKRVTLYASIEKSEVTEQLISKALKEAGMLRRETTAISPQQLITIVAESFNVKISDLVSKKKNKSIVVPRQAAMYLLKEKQGLSLKEIGAHLGNRDHSTVKHGIDTITQKIKDEDFVSDMIKKIIKKL